ncbi:cytosine permease [Alicyclobacillus sp. TC]|uniref:NCS1 family nucleobase:cation symporter-1 n=2 Tax=Alicyclobacillus tolerans TaxID=90970 RepID=A0ABT9LSB1_9BACL|nr:MULTISPECIES: cytosine permease [Alicyclobacillus]MDP9727150.1 NCS1 family nucleobase:cation symporter-1 [Alicyclobacillus tengchongensis]QRF22918.1 cytosine permease [Alicyclobacillus sp. TC]SHK46881.1 nucleobase:cation symporter-1, NCS1 family [Alicyclobacillus montanus]
MFMEKHSIDYIPSHERHGKARSLFTIWFSANAQITTVVTGVLAIVLGLNLGYAVLAIVIGNLLGGLFMAYHSAQGPKLGVPQMIQSRAQFGKIGAILPLILVIVMYIGFFSSSAVLGAQALSGVLHLSVTMSIIIVNIAAVLLVTIGYDLIHTYEKYVAIVFVILFLYISVRMMQFLPHVHSTPVPFHWSAFLLVISIMASWQLTYAPYVADYSRYLPENTSVTATFFWTYLGSVISSSWMMILGAMAAIIAPKQSADMVQYLEQLSGTHWFFVTGIIIFLGVLAINALNLYGGFMSVTTTLGAIRHLHVTGWQRMLFILSVGAIGTLISILGQGDFLTEYSNFILLLLYFIVPWTSINLVDFYFLRKGKYDIEGILGRNDAYAGINLAAIVAYVIGVLVQFPFMNTTLHEGFIAKWMHGADIAWVVGLFVSAFFYYLPMRLQMNRELSKTQLNL